MTEQEKQDCGKDKVNLTPQEGFDGEPDNANMEDWFEDATRTAVDAARALRLIKQTDDDSGE